MSAVPPVPFSSRTPRSPRARVGAVPAVLGALRMSQQHRAARREVVRVQRELRALRRDADAAGQQRG